MFKSSFCYLKQSVVINVAVFVLIKFVQSVLAEELPKSFLSREMKKIYQSSKFVDYISIPNARVPIVKFRHIGTNFRCDLTTYSKMGIYNTMLLRYSSIVFIKIVLNLSED